jgi:hypothetical protein
MLTQIVSPALPTYGCNLCLRNGDIEMAESKPIVGVMKTAQGYILHQIWPGPKTVNTFDRLSAEGVKSFLSECGYCEPVFMQGIEGDDFSFIESKTNLRGYDANNFLDQILREVCRQTEIDIAEFEVIGSMSNDEIPTLFQRPRPIYVSTAQQIGLFPNDNIFPLVQSLLPRVHPAYSARFLRKV